MNPSTASGSPVTQKFSTVWIADASALEAIKKHLGQLQEKSGKLLVGKILMVVEAFTHCPIAVWYDTNPNCNETTWWEALLRCLPIGGLIIVDMDCRNRFTTAFGTNFRGNGFPQFVFF